MVAKLVYAVMVIRCFPVVKGIVTSQGRPFYVCFWPRQRGDDDSMMVPPVRHRANMAHLPADTPLQLVIVGIS